MSRAMLILANPSVRAKAVDWVQKAPEGTRVTFQEAKRSTDQNARLWAALTDIASQALHNGRKYPADIWKCIFLNALGKQVTFIPALDGQSVFPIGLSSSDLSKAEMSDLLALIESWGAENNITFHVPDRT